MSRFVKFADAAEAMTLTAFGCPAQSWIATAENGERFSIVAVYAGTNERPLSSDLPRDFDRCHYERTALRDRERDAATIQARAASPIRPLAGRTACTAGLGLFDHVDAPTLF